MSVSRTPNLLNVWLLGDFGTKRRNVAPPKAVSGEVSRFLHLQGNEPSKRRDEAPRFRGLSTSEARFETWNPSEAGETATGAARASTGVHRVDAITHNLILYRRTG